MSAVGAVEYGALNRTPGAPERTPHTGEAKSRLIWVGLIAGALGTHVILCVVTATIATSDPSFAVVPGYHQQALRWDEKLAADRAGAALGWSAEVVPGSTADVLGRRAVVVTLRDRDGRPVTGANVEANVFHHARAAEAHTVSFAETADAGTYAATTEMRRAGLWEVRLSVRRGDGRFVATQTIDLRTDAKG
jgi:nitrogen fixation protein FixH